METTIFNAPIAEYKTRKAAEKFAARVINGAYVSVAKNSSFDMYHPQGKKVYQVFPKIPPC